MKKLLLISLAVLALISCKEQPKPYSWDEDLAYRLSVDFSWNRDQVKEYIQKYIPDVTDEQIDAWTESGKLESMMINGERKYFRRGASVLFHIDSACAAAMNAVNYPGVTSTEYMSNYLIDMDLAAEKEALAKTIAEVKETGNPIATGIRMKAKYTLTVDPDAVPAGEIIRCWLPYPRTDVPRQKDVKFLGASQEDYQFSDPACPHSTIYMEKAAVAGEPTVFSVDFEFTSCPEWNKITPDMVKPYDTTTALYKENTAEREKHIIFSERMRKLADSLTAGIENPYEQTKAIFTWIRKVYPWAGAREYSTIENIPEYVLDYGHGDCGQVTLLLMNLLRIKGIPCHWQSGLTTDPDGWNLHDWCEVYFEGIGWVPVDQSASVRSYAKDDEDMKYYFLGGYTKYRMIVNSDYGRALSPEKQYPRSETVDFQRGEVEWRGGNLFYPFWSSDMEIEYTEL